MTPLAHALERADRFRDTPAATLMASAIDLEGCLHYALPHERISMCRTAMVEKTRGHGSTNVAGVCSECVNLARKVRQHRSAQGTERFQKRRQDEQVEAFLQQVDEEDPYMRVAMGVWQHVSGRGRVVPEHVKETLRQIIKRAV